MFVVMMFFGFQVSITTKYGCPVCSGMASHRVRQELSEAIENIRVREVLGPGAQTAGHDGSERCAGALSGSPSDSLPSPPDEHVSPWRGTGTKYSGSLVPHTL